MIFTTLKEKYTNDYKFINSRILGLSFTVIMYRFTVIGSINPDCDLVWRDVCYKYFTQQKNWYDANSSCVAWGGGLVNLSSQRTINVATAIQPDSSSAWVSNATSTACGYLKINTMQETSQLNGECSMLLYYICSKSSKPLLLFNLSNLFTSITMQSMVRNN